MEFKNKILPKTLSLALAAALSASWTSLSTITFLAFTPHAYAADQLTIVYGGRLVTSTGAPISGPLNLQVQFFHSATGGSPVGNIAIQFSDVPFVDGIFQLDLKLTEEEWHQVLPNLSTPVYIEITNLTYGGKFPRQLYNVVPYAMKVPTDEKSITYNHKGQLSLKVSAPPSSNGQILSTTTDGTLSWINPPSGGGGGSITGITAGTGLTGGGTSGSITLGVDVGTSPNKIVQLDATGKLPAVDGSLLTGINATTITGQGSLATANSVAGGLAGTITDNSITDHDISSSAAIATSKLSGSLTSVTGHGLGTAATLNVGTGVNNIVQLDGSSRLPAVDGSALTNLNGSNISSGTVANSRINWGAPGNIGGVTPGTGTFTAITANNLGLNLQDNDGSANFAVIKAATNMSANQTYTLPAAADAGKYLTTDASGNLSWNTPAGAGDMQKSTYDINTDNLIDLSKGGTGAANASDARTNLGLGTAATFDVGTGNNQIVQLDATAKLPAIDGAALTNLNGANIATGTINSARIDWASPGTIGSTAPNTGSFTSLQAASSEKNTAAFAFASSTANDATSAGTKPLMQVTQDVAPTSGTSDFSALAVRGTINSTGSASGLIRGIDVNPTLTSITQYRAIDIRPNDANAYGIYQSGANTRNFFNGKVGIGTDAPSYALDVSGTVRATSFISTSGSSDWGSSDLLNVSRMSIGTSSAGSDLFFGSGANRSISVANQVTAGNNLTVQAGGTTGSNLNGGNLVLSSGTANGTGSSQIEFKTANGGAPVTSMTVLGNGKVGIGTSSPTGTLTIESLSGGIAGNLTLRNSSSANGSGSILTFENGATTDQGTIATVVESASAASMRFSTRTGGSVTEVMRIDADGDVGVGTATPQTKFEVAGTASAQRLISWGSVDVFAPAGGAYTPSGSTAAYPPSAYSVITNTSSGADTTVAMRFAPRRSGDTFYSYVGAISPATGFSPPIVFGQQTGAASWEERMRIDADGSVGIGTSTPLAKLHLNGGIGSLATGLVFGDGDSGIFEDVDDRLEIALPAVSGIQFQRGNQVHSAASTNAAITAPNGVSPQILGRSMASGSGPSGGVNIFGGDHVTSGIDAGSISIRAGVNSGDASRNGKIGLLVGGNEVLTVSKSSKVGVGITEPVAFLDAWGTETTDGTNVSGPLRSVNTTNNFDDPTAKSVLSLVRSGKNTFSWGNVANLRMSRFDNSDTGAYTQLDFRLNHSTTMIPEVDVLTMRSNGRVGIGNNAPSYALDVNGIVRASSFISTSGASDWNSQSMTNLSAISIGTSSAGTDLFFGAGADRTMSVATQATAGNSLTIQAGGTSGSNLNGGDLILSSGTANGTGSSKIEFKTASGGAPVSSMVIDGSGKVGIGESNPSSMLTVGGNPSTVANTFVGIRSPSHNATTAVSNAGFVTQEIATPTASSAATFAAAVLESGSASGNVNDFTNALGLQGLRTNIVHRGSGTVTGAANFIVGGPTISGGGTISNMYGLYISPMDIANVGTGYGIYQSGANDRNFFAAPIGIGTSSPDAPIHIVKNSTPHIIAENQGTAQYASAELQLITRETTANNRLWRIFAEKYDAGANTGASNFQIRKSNEAGDYAVTPILIDSANNLILQAGWTAGGGTYGNVGIGTDTPYAKLHVVGPSAEMRLGGSATNQDLKMTFYDANSTQVGNIVYEGSSTDKFLTIDANGAPAGLRLQSSAASNTPISFWVNSGEKARITASGGLGLGTWNPQSRLDVSGGAAIGSYAGVDAAPANGLIVSGNVGIGSNSPTNKIEITPSAHHAFGTAKINRIGTGAGNGEYWGMGFMNAGNTDAMVLGSSSSTYSTGGLLPWVGNSNSFLYYANNLRIGTGTGATPILNLSTAGNVGVYNDNPTAKLHIGGTAGVDGIKFPDGSLQTTAAGAETPVLRYSRTTVAYNASDATKDSTCSGDFGSSYTAASALEMLLYFGPKYNASLAMEFNLRGVSASYQITTGAIFQTTTNATLVVACVKASAFMRASTTTVAYNASAATKDAACTTDYGSNYGAATNLEVSSATRSYIVFDSAGLFPFNLRDSATLSYRQSQTGLIAFGANTYPVYCIRIN